jgi:hypothetical protein
MEERMDGRENGWKREWMEERMDGRANGWKRDKKEKRLDGREIRSKIERMKEGEERR